MKLSLQSNIRTKKRLKIRSKIQGTVQRPRLSVFRSGKHIYAQLIDDQKGQTLVSFSDQLIGETKGKKISKIEKAAIVGQKLAQLAQKEKIKEVIFDRGGFLYHGRVKALADGAREGGLIF